MQITTIKLQKRTKRLLDTFKTKDESYNTAINKLVLQVKHQNMEKKLKEAYQNRAKYLGEFEDWENASNEVPNE
ncbi:hypothetical protein JXB27_02455 [Candidatus Woesearchaeota archaeon]|nr:hypothetical protein [Candidatus Woesearchaeota archaeon]